MESVFCAIETEARFLTSYPKFAAAHQDAIRRHSQNETPATAKAVLQSGRTCEQCRQRLIDLARLVRLHLPEAYAKLQLIPDPAHWHMIQRFDWTPVIAELRSIEAAACNPATQWSRVDSPANWAKLYGVTARTFVKWINAKPPKIRAKVIDSKNIMVDLRDMPTRNR